MYNNILVITSSTDNAGTGVTWIEDLNLLPEGDMRNALIAAIEGREEKCGSLNVYDEYIYSDDLGYIFNPDGIVMKEFIPGSIVNHLISYCI